jgi:hypothetical protein
VQESEVNGAILAVGSDIVPGMEDEFNRWYDQEHIPKYASKMPYLKSVRRYYSKRGKPQSLAIYEYSSMEDLKKSLASAESKAAGDDADKQVGKLAKSFSFNTYSLTRR